MSQITVRMNDFLFNAGILGFIKILDEAGEKYEKDTNSIIFDSSVFEKFDELYFETLKITYEENTRCNRLLKQFKQVEDNEATEEELDKLIKDLNLQLTKRGSYEKALEIIKSKGNSYDVVTRLKEVTKKDSHLDLKKERIKEIANYFRENKEVFLYKDIIYNYVSQYWNKVAFFNNNNVKNDIKEEYKKYFVDTVNTHINGSDKSSTIKCIECGEPILKKEAKSISWLNDKGVDIVRKTSYFWNHNLDIMVCPICSVIYSCSPLGFNNEDRNGIFINNNSSVDLLIRSNYTNRSNMDIIKSGVNLEEDGTPQFYELISSIVGRIFIEGEKEHAEKDLVNIQVVKRKVEKNNDEHYEFHILPKDLLGKFLTCLNEFKKISAVKLKYNKDKDELHVYEDVFRMVCNNENLFKYVNRVMRICMAEKKNPNFLKAIISIQINIFGRKEEEIKDMKELMDEVYKSGNKMRKKYVEIDKVSSADKLNAFAYQLLNTLSSNNPKRFMHIIITMYMSVGELLPKRFSDVFESDELFNIIGYSYLDGLMSNMS